MNSRLSTSGLSRLALGAFLLIAAPALSAEPGECDTTPKTFSGNYTVSGDVFYASVRTADFHNGVGFESQGAEFSRALVDKSALAAPEALKGMAGARVTLRLASERTYELTMAEPLLDRGPAAIFGLGAGSTVTALQAAKAMRESDSVEIAIDKPGTDFHMESGKISLAGWAEAVDYRAAEVERLLRIDSCQKYSDEQWYLGN